MVRLREGKPCRQKRGKIPIYSCFWTKGSSNLSDVVNIKSLNTGASLFCLHLALDLTASSTPLAYDERYLKAIFMSLHKNTSYYSCCAFQHRFTHLSTVKQPLIQRTQRPKQVAAYFRQHGSCMFVQKNKIAWTSCPPSLRIISDAFVKFDCFFFFFRIRNCILGASKAGCA